MRAQSAHLRTKCAQPALRALLPSQELRRAIEIGMKVHPEPVTNDDEFELLLSRSKIFQKNIFVLLEVLCCNFYKLPKFLPYYKRKVEKSKGGNQKYFLSILKASIIKKQD